MIYKDIEKDFDLLFNDRFYQELDSELDLHLSQIVRDRIHQLICPAGYLLIHQVLGSATRNGM